MKPMLARTYGPRFSHFPCFLQPKLNGVRALTQNTPTGIVMQSRDEKLWRYDLLREIYDELSWMYDFFRKNFASDVLTTILDGELYVHGWRLQDINAAIAVNRKDRTDKTGLVQYHLFDTIPDLQTTFLDRWVAFSSVPEFQGLKHIQIVPTHACSSNEELQQYFRHYISEGYEGVMLRTDKPYELGETTHGTQYRSRTLWKYKHWEDDEFVCVGVTPGEGKASIGIGALVCGGHPENYPNISVSELGKMRTFKVGVGFTDADRIAFAANPPIGKLVRVRYLELTADGIPFNPSFLAILS